MPTIFTEVINTDNWTIKQQQTGEAFCPVLKAYLSTQMQNQPVCDRFYDSYQNTIKAVRNDRSEWQTRMRIPVVESMGYKFEGPEAGKQYAALYHLLGAPTCLNWSLPAAAAPGSPAYVNALEKTTKELVEYLVTLGINQNELGALLELIKGK
jgi:hypothetical protein